MSDFYTMRGYKIKNEEKLSDAMEDYIEMIYRLYCKNNSVRVNDISTNLNVQPPSTTRMLKKLSDLGYVNYEKYGLITLTKKGEDIGKYLLYRHEITYNFLKIIGVKNNLLEQTEKIEHAINEETLIKIDNLIDFLSDFKNL